MNYKSFIDHKSFVNRWNCIQQKAYLSMGGIFGVMMGIIVR